MNVRLDDSNPSFSVDLVFPGGIPGSDRQGPGGSPGAFVVRERGAVRLDATRGVVRKVATTPSADHAEAAVVGGSASRSRSHVRGDPARRLCAAGVGRR